MRLHLETIFSICDLKDFVFQGLGFLFNAFIIPVSSCRHDDRVGFGRFREVPRCPGRSGTVPDKRGRFLNHLKIVHI